MASQSAIAVTEVGKPVTRISMPKPDGSELAAHELLLKVTVAGRQCRNTSDSTFIPSLKMSPVAPLDAKMRDQNPFGLPLPIITSTDAVGIVIKTGSEELFSIGSHVFVQQGLQYLKGGLQEYTVVDGRYAAIVPEGISDAEAALYPINAVTSARCLFTPEGLGFPFPGTSEAAIFNYSAQHVVILGSGTNCGKLAIQYAKLAGIGKIVAVASASGESLLRDLGASHVVDRQSVQIEDQVSSAVGGEVLNVFDTYGNVDLGVSLLSEKQKGTLVHITHSKLSEEVARKKKSKFDQKFLQGISSADPVFGQQIWKQLPIWLQARDIKPLSYNIIEGMDVDKINEVLDSYRDGKGKDRYHVRVSASD